MLDLIFSTAICTCIALMGWQMIRQENEIKRLRELIRALAVRMENDSNNND